MISKRLGIGAIIVLAIVSAALGTVAGICRIDTIYPGVRVGGIDLGGLTLDQAEQALKSPASEVDREQVTLRYGKEQTSVGMSSLGGRPDVETSARMAYSIGREGGILQRLHDVEETWRNGVELPVALSFDREVASSYIRSLATRIDRKPVDARLVVADGAVSVIPEKEGIKLDLSKSLANIEQAVNSGHRTVDLAVVSSAPRVTSDGLRGIDGILGKYSTQYKTWQRDRNHNLRLACNSINGTILKPGEVFSYNKIVGPRLEELGFRNAPVFVKGEVEQGVGGGICQVSTTVYNAALLSNLKIVRRTPHSRPVIYAPVGRDATVVYPSLDLRFENNTDTAVYISASLGKLTVDVTVFGKKLEGQEVSVVAVDHKVVRAPVVTKVVATPEEAKKASEPGRSGHRVSVYRITKVGGEVIHRELISNDYYRPQSKVVTVVKTEQI